MSRSKHTTIAKGWRLVWGQKRRGQWQEQLHWQKQGTWQQWQRWREDKGNGNGKWNVDSNGNGNSNKDGILELWREQYLKRIWGGGGGRMANNSIKLIMHLSTITLTSITIKQYLSYPNIDLVLSSFKVASLMWWNKRHADTSSRWPLQRRWAILCVTNLCSWWSITWSIWGRRERSIKRQMRRKSLGWGYHIGKTDMSISRPLQSTGGRRFILVSGVSMLINIFRCSHVLNFGFVSGKPP